MADSYEGYVTGTQELTINKREVTVTGDGWDADQPYTGTEYSKDTYQFANVVEGQTASISYELKGTEVGPYTGTFGEDFKVVIDDSGTLGLGKTDVTANYKLTDKTPGTLTITKSEIAKYVTLTPEDVIKTYDGTTYTAGTAKAVDANGKEVKVEYSVNGTDWTEDPTSIAATDVADSVTVQVRASVDGTYEGYVEGTQTLEIKKRPLTVKANDATKKFDGEELTEKGTTVTSGSLVEEQSYTATVVGSQTYVGISENTVTKVIVTTKDGKEVTDNYNIDVLPGTLEVTDGTLIDLSLIHI